MRGMLRSRYFIVRSVGLLREVEVRSDESATSELLFIKKNMGQQIDLGLSERALVKTTH